MAARRPAFVALGQVLVWCCAVRGRVSAPEVRVRGAMERTELAALAAEGYAFYAAEAAEFAEVSAEADAEACDDECCARVAAGNSLL